MPRCEGTNKDGSPCGNSAKARSNYCKIHAAQGHTAYNDFTLIGDTPYEFDLLGYHPYVEAMGQVLSHDQLQTPFAVGVFGRWGTGKSTFMHLLNKRLDKHHNGKFHTLLFQPWQFEDKEEVWKTLILTVIRYLELQTARIKSETQMEVDRISQTLQHLILGVGKLTLNKTIGTMTGGAVTLDQVLQAYAETARDNSKFINTFREEFGTLKAEILHMDGNTRSRLFIFIDDLDRCTPENCIMVLEAMKLFFDLEECVFILGIDSEVVQKGIEHKYSGSLRIRGQDYLDKMIQLPFMLPPVRSETFREFVRINTEAFQFDKHIQELIIVASGGNPRRAKRLSNCLQLTRSVSKSLLEDTVSESSDQSKLALLLTLQVRYPVAYMWLTRNLLTYRELSDGWMTMAPEKTAEGDETSPGYREQLTQFLIEAYGDELAGQNAERFLELWRYGHEVVGVADFKDKDELRAYIEITALVDDQQVSGVKSKRDDTRTAVTTRNGVDEKLSGEELPEPEQENQKPPDSAIQQEFGRLEPRINDTVDRWNAYIRRGVMATWHRLPTLEPEGLELVSRSRTLVSELQSMVQRLPVHSPSINSAIEDCKLLTSERVYRHLRSSSRALTLLGPVLWLFVASAALLLVFGADVFLVDASPFYIALSVWLGFPTLAIFLYGAYYWRRAAVALRGVTGEYTFLQHCYDILRRSPILKVFGKQ